MLDKIPIGIYGHITLSHSRARSRRSSAGTAWRAALEMRRRAPRAGSGTPGSAGAVAKASVRSARRGGPSCGVPMRRGARMDRWVGLSPKQYGVDLKPATGGLAEQASNTARGTPDVSALRDCYLLCTQNSSCTGSWGACAPAFRAPSIYFRRRCREGDYGRTRRPANNAGGGALTFHLSPHAGRGRSKRRGREQRNVRLRQ